MSTQSAACKLLQDIIKAGQDTLSMGSEIKAFGQKMVNDGEAIMQVAGDIIADAQVAKNKLTADPAMTYESLILSTIETHCHDLGAHLNDADQSAFACVQKTAQTRIKETGIVNALTDLNDII